MLNWTLTLYGEQDPEFKGTPIHTTIGYHEDQEHEISITSTAATSTPTDADDTPSRPTRIKPDSKPSTAEKEEDQIPNDIKDVNDYLTVVYAIFGSMAVIGLAVGFYLFKRKNWHLVPTTDRQQSRSDGYEFDVLQPLTQIDEEEEGEEEDRLLRNNH